MEELAIGGIKLLQLAAIIQEMSKLLPIRLLIEEHAQDTNLADFDRELKTFQQRSKIIHGFLKLDALDVKGLNQLLLIQEVLQHHDRFGSEDTLFKTQIDDARVRGLNRHWYVVLHSTHGNDL